MIAVTDTEDRSELMRNRGAFSAIKFTKKLQKDILSLTDDKGADIVYDAVGEEMFEALGNW